MKVQEFIEYMGKNVSRTMKEEQILSTVKKQLEVKSYLPIKEKKELVDKIIYKSVYFENGNYRIDAIDCYMYFIMYTIDTYTNLEIDNVEQCHDALAESALMPVIIASLGQEYNDINTFLNMKRDEILERNSLEMQVGNFLDTILEKIDGFTGVFDDIFASLNIDKDDISKVIEMFVQQQ